MISFSKTVKKSNLQLTFFTNPLFSYILHPKISLINDQNSIEGKQSEKNHFKLTELQLQHYREI
jgi:hypothetical protein